MTSFSLSHLLVKYFAWYIICNHCTSGQLAYQISRSACKNLALLSQIVACKMSLAFTTRSKVNYQLNKLIFPAVSCTQHLQLFLVYK